VNAYSFTRESLAEASTVYAGRGATRARGAFGDRAQRRRFRDRFIVESAGTAEPMRSHQDMACVPVAAREPVRFRRALDRVDQSGQPLPHERFTLFGPR
jgi:hypothetical protein